MEEAEEERILELNRRVSADLPLTRAETEAWRRWILLPARPRKRKKRRKKKLPQGVSSRGRARRRQRQCLLFGCSVFPSVDDWSLMLGIMASMDRKDSYALFVLGSGTCKARFAGILHLALCSSRFFQAQMPCRQARREVCIMAGLDQRDIMLHSSPSAAVACFLLVLLVDAVHVAFPEFVGRLAAVSTASCGRQFVHGVNAEPWRFHSCSSWTR